MTICTVHPLPYHPDPAHWFERVRKAPGAILLDSGRPVAERGRYDLISAWPQQVLEPNVDESGTAFFTRLRSALHALGTAEPPAQLELPFTGGLLGFLGYDFGSRLERLPVTAVQDLALPAARFGLYAWALVTDHHRRAAHLIFHPRLEMVERARLIELFERESLPDPATFSLTSPFSADTDRDGYKQAIERIHDYIQAGDCYQVNYAQRFRATCAGDPWEAYRALRAACPTPYSGYVSVESGAIVSLSPERFMRLANGVVETRPIKGTRPRRSNPDEDHIEAQALQNSAKDRAENLMIVDLLRNDLGRSCEIGSVRVPELFKLESYPNVHHLVSSVSGTLAIGKDPLDLLEGSFPGGSITGAPKIRAMQIIDELEPTRRSIYCGSLLYLDVRGEMDSSIAIRTLLIQRDEVTCWAGGGIVADSDWEAEHQETLDKVRVLMETLEAL
ncbi:aminodeoxychorismate synthase component I [Stutzerimonas zhaodongensis]|uniref:aminodeoxychorismate synthase n=1 Tax=Stutzerimonas zhaodongensis TaxID=1176257 RepID=A0A3M2HXB9_9GAMM|nr:aminodeoxychorismate synthase component I [Stutzerimonas zhaodongensis]MCQ4314543.1 aminodeoxychorismate synthase component I [Stutzerimonas zhaodongensis]RMH92059.1 aminodeoxychorismate synthase component I [Stutzerimonas zhaodongensis]